ncbi:MAG TPA: response regulator [Salinisphaeraceae bacterium]|nr:response regulator [Salinisphaeraceae bacterium]
MNEGNMMRASEYAILYVDDEEMALKYFQRALGRNFTVHIAADAQAGLEILEAQGDNIGVLVSDQRMPGESGVELLKKVRRHWPHIVRILTTAYADLEDAIEAVNRGEIFRYITKPWDIKTLRTEVRQAMELFQLRHEHAALMREKMGVWQRMVQLGRLRDLVVMSASFTHLRYSQNAVAQYLADHLRAPEPSELISSRYLDLWQLTEHEIRQTLAFIGDIIARTATTTNHGERFPTALDATQLKQLISNAFAQVDCADAAAIPVIQVAEEPAALMLQELARVADAPASGASLQPTAAGDAVALTLPTAAMPADSNLTANAAAGLLAAYLLAFHHGGRLELQTVGKQHQYVMTLPANPEEATLPPLQPGWLESLLVRLEGWD